MTPSAIDPAHWLYRLPPADWLAAAATELRAAEATFARHALRPGVTHCRRGAGMALNALLWQRERPAWGRSYMEHVTALASDDEAPAPIREAAKRLVATPTQAPPLVQLGRAGAMDPAARAVLDAAEAIVAWAAGPR